MFTLTIPFFGYNDYFPICELPRVFNGPAQFGSSPYCQRLVRKNKMNRRTRRG